MSINTTSKYLFDYIYLAEVSYANFSTALLQTDTEQKDNFTKKAISNPEKPEEKEDGSEPQISGRGKPLGLAELVTKNYEVIAHYTDRDKQFDDITDVSNTESGFSATLFKGKADGSNPDSYVLGFKGTDGYKDLLAVDVAGIMTDGAASTQIIDMYNFMQQIKGANTQDGNGNPASYRAAYLNPNNEYNKLYFQYMTDFLLKPSPIDKALIELKLKEIRFNALKDGYFIDGGNIYSIDFMDSNLLYKDERRYVLSLPEVANPEDIKVTAVGHSLGGHLAAAFSRLFPEHLDDVTVMINGAGTGDWLSIATLIINGVPAKINVDNLFNSLARKTTSFNEERIINVTGDKGMNFVANDWWFALDQPGQQPEIFIESAGKELLAHGVASVTNSAAIIDLFLRISPHLQKLSPQELFDIFNPVLKVISVDDNKAHEDIIYALGELYGIKENQVITTNDRNMLYQRLNDLHEKINETSEINKKFNHTNKISEGFISTNIEDLIRFAEKDLGPDSAAARFSLKFVLPFYIVDRAAITEYNVDGILNKFDAIYSPNGMTDEEINSRIEFLKLFITQSDYTPYINLIPNLNFSPNIYYEDLLTQKTFGKKENMGNPNVLATALIKPFNNPQTIFGSDKSENQGELTTGGSSDRIFAGAGNDVLNGDKGNDYLEGGTDFDTYVIQDSDYVMDADGAGELVFESLTGNKPSYFQQVDATNGIWRSVGADKQFDGLFTAYREATHLVVRENGSKNQATIENFFTRAEVVDNVSSFLDIHLTGKLEVDISNTQGYVHYSGATNFYHVFYPGKESYVLYGGAKNDTLFGQLAQNVKVGEAGYALIVNLGAGHDLAFGSLHADYLAGSDGTDVIQGSTFIAVESDKRSAREKALDADTLVGGNGGDFISGMAGDDTIHTGNIGEHLLTEASDAQGDLATGGDGNDVIHGSAARDVLQGGEGSDVVHGGANADLILGDSFIRANVSFNRQTYGDANPITYEHRVDPTTGQWKTQGYPMVTYLHVDEGKWSWSVSEDGRDYSITRVRGGFNNNVHLVQNGGDDYLYAGAGDDFVVGQTGNDVIHGQDGNDILYGDDNRQAEVSGNDHLVGGKGSDKLIGGKGQDSYYFSQEDMQSEGAGVVTDIVIDDGKDSDGQLDHIYLDGKAISTLRWHYNEKAQVWQQDNNLWQMRLIDDTVVIRYGQDSGTIQLLNYVAGDYGVDLTPPKPSTGEQPNEGGNSSPSTIVMMPDPTPASASSVFVQTGSQGNDLFMTGTNSIEDPSLFMLDWNNMSIEYTQEDVAIDGGAGDDYLESGQGNDRLYGNIGNDQLSASHGDDELQGGEGNDTLQGGDGGDKHYGEAGNDRLLGQEGNDFIDGGEGDDTLAGGLGEDRLYGGLGNDLYLYRGQDGHEHLYDSAGEDTLYLADVEQSAFAQALSQQGNHLLLKFNDEQQITVYDFFNNSSAIEHFAFADGNSVSAATLYQQFNRSYQGNSASYQSAHALDEMQALAAMI